MKELLYAICFYTGAAWWILVLLIAAAAIGILVYIKFTNWLTGRG